MVEMLKKPIGGFDKFCEIVGLTDKDPIIAKTVVQRKYLMAVLADIAKEHPSKSDQKMKIEFSIIGENEGVLVMKFKDKNGEIIPKTPSHVYGIAPVWEPDSKSFSPVPKETSAIERELRDEIAKLEREIYRLKVAGKTHPSGIAEMEAATRELYAKVAKAGV
jgi:hypothetical protein